MGKKRAVTYTRATQCALRYANCPDERQKPYAPPFPCGLFRKFVSYGGLFTTDTIISAVYAQCQEFFRILFCKILATQYIVVARAIPTSGIGIKRGPREGAKSAPSRGDVKT